MATEAEATTVTEAEAASATGAEVAIVTGAASGIGRAVAARLAAQGHPVALWDVNAAAGQQAAAELAAAGQTAEFMQVDVSDRNRVAECVAATAARLGPPQILVTCAAITHSAPIAELATEDWYRVMRVDLDGTFFCLAEVAASLLRANLPGSIVLISSTAALSGFHKRGAYCAAKSGIVGLTRAAALDLARHGIRVNSVAPGSTLTGMTEHNAADPAMREIIDVMPLKRWGQPAEIAEAVTFLAGPHSSFVTGIVLPVDGGWSAGRMSLSSGII